MPWKQAERPIDYPRPLTDRPIHVKGVDRVFGWQVGLRIRCEYLTDLGPSGDSVESGLAGSLGKSDQEGEDSKWDGELPKNGPAVFSKESRAPFACSRRR